MSGCGAQRMTARSGHSLVLGALLFVGLVTADGVAQGRSSRSMAEKLATLRTEVNDLDATLRSKRDSDATALRGLQMRANELELAEDAERIRVKELEAEIIEHRAAAAVRDQASESLRSAVRSAVSKLQKVVADSIPYRREQRLAALSRIRRDLAAGKADAPEAAARVWRFVEDERRLASTVEPAELSLVLGGDASPTLVRAVRVGTVAMFVYAGAHRWGRVVRGPDGAFRYSDITDRGQISEIQRLFESVAKQIREGRYHLPLVEVQRRRQ